jgi:hypothetical protein
MKRIILIFTIFFAVSACAKNEENTKVYAVFFSLSTNMSNEILSNIEERCNGIEFVGKEIVNDNKKSNLILQNIEDSKKNLDGLILFCNDFTDKKYILTGLPTIIVDCTSSSSSSQTGFKKAVAFAKEYDTRFITASYSTEGFSSDVSEFVPGDIPTPQAVDILAAKIKLFNVISKLKNSKLLTIQDYDKINPIDLGGWDAVNAPVNDYDKSYPGKLKEFLGIDLVTVRSNEYYREIEKVKEKEAEKVADMWINEAEQVIDIKKEDVIRSAELYIALKELLKKYNPDAITMSSWALIPDDVIKAMPSLAEMELAKELIPCCCESLINPTVTQMIGTYITGRPGFVGDILRGFPPAVPVNEIPNDMLIIGHCYGPINPHGNDRVPYTIRNHAYYELGWDKIDDPRLLWMKEKHLRVNEQLKKQNITLVAIRVKWPINEVVTVVKTNIYDKQIEIYTGKTVDGNYLYKNFDNRVCRTKIAISLDKPFKRLRQDRWGVHRVVFYGDYKQEIKDFASLNGFEIIE